jgi:hypothetical protein
MAIQRGAQAPSPVGDVALLGSVPEASTACPFVWSGTCGPGSTVRCFASSTFMRLCLVCRQFVRDEGARRVPRIGFLARRGLRPG